MAFLNFVLVHRFIERTIESEIIIINLYIMLRRDTANIHNNHTRTKHTILRSKRVIPQYSDTLCEESPDAQEYRFGDFSVLNHRNHPGVVYYFIELTDPNGNPISGRSGNNTSNNNNSINNSSNTHRI